MFSPIAIVGQACLLPSANSPTELWQLISQRRVAISFAPASRWRGDRESLLASGICSSDAGGFVEGFDSAWDPTRYRISAELLQELDPVFQWLLHVGANALVDAGIAPEDPMVKRTGAIIGNLMYPSEALVDLAQCVYLPSVSAPTRHPLNRFCAGSPVHVLCNALGLGRGGFAIDAACASSLYAIKLASDWLQSGRADVMLAGAINRVEGLLIHAGFTALRALSPSGSSRPFHRDADGLVPAEGAALIVLKRLEDAEKADDCILGVIRGIGLSNDGRGSGMLTPSVEGQIRAMKAAYVQSGLQPSDVSLIECHATGTSIGDAVELQSMSEVFSGLNGIPLGSLKSNLGHLITTSGAAGVIKVLEALRHRERPATLNAWPANRAIEGSPFRLVEQQEEWTVSPGRTRCAAINSFGFGGNNAHLLLEEYQPGFLPGTVSAPVSPCRAAVVSMAARMGNGRTTTDFVADFFTGASRIRPLPDGSLVASADEVRLPSTGLVFPPRDLDRTLAQQNLLLEIACEALNGKSLPTERTAAFIGMNCDAESARTVLRAGLSDSDTLDSGFDAARVVGCMPNILSNRLNRQFDFGGPSFTVAAEELSGVRALDLAVDALTSGSIAAAIVGAVDLCVEPVHHAAISALSGNKQAPADGACVLLLKRVEDAKRDNDPIYSIIEMAAADTPATVDPSPVTRRVRDCFGHVHAASALIEVTAGIVALSAAAIPAAFGSEMVPLVPGRNPHRIRMDLEAMGGQSASVTIVEADHLYSPQQDIPAIVTFSSENLADLIHAIEFHGRSGSRKDETGKCRLAVVASPEDLPEQLTLATSYLKRIADSGADKSPPPEGIYFHPRKIGGDLAFVFTGATAAYPQMGRDMLLALPELARGVSARCDDVERYAGWIYRHAPTFVANDFERLCGSSFLCQLHSEFTQNILRLRPQAAIGLSSGETNALYALRAWSGMHELLADLEDSGLYTEILGGSGKAVREGWSKLGVVGDCWTAYWISAPLKDVEDVIHDEPSARITIVNSPRDVVIGGESEACRRVVARIGAHRCIRLESDFAVHCPEILSAAPVWRRLHHRRTVPPPDIRFYSNAFGGAYELTDDSVADALTKQALEMIDFPRTIRQAWEDGVRIFVEHGPRNQCTQSIQTILGDREFVAVALDIPTRSALRQALNAAAELWSAGVGVDLATLRSRLAPLPSKDESRSAVRIFPAHPPLPSLVREERVFRMAAAPALSQLLQPITISSPARTHRDEVASIYERMTRAHQEHLANVVLLDQTYQEMQSRLLRTLRTLTGRSTGALVSTRVAEVPARSFTRKELEIHASGRISEIFGPAFAGQDRYLRQVRMPEPPLLLADRVMSLRGEPGSMGLGSIETETDVVANAWYLHHERMPAGIAIESGQADLMLISWLGIDRLNQGRRVYRLLGCDLTFSGSLPSVGQTLHYAIHVDSHASHGDVRMFFFHYDCFADGKLKLSVRNGQAGFFTDQELATSEGVLWSPEANPPKLQTARPASTCVTSRRSFNSDAVSAFAEGRIVECFGPEFEFCFTHTRTPRIQTGPMQLLQSVPIFDPSGGPWQRGYLRAEWSVRPDDWFFKGHFKNDPCMPGTLMFEGCMQAMAFYLTALGFTLDRDGWRFEPAPDETYSLRCRGQVLPSSKTLVYEVFVEQVVAGSAPTLYADVLCTVDGLKAFHCHRLGLRLVPDWPMSRLQTKPDRSVFDSEALMACALGRPSEAFGPTFARFDGPNKVPRLPTPPYHFMSRVVRAETTPTISGSVAEVEYDVPPDVWYFTENGYAVMPVCVLIEVLLQPCGWLASYARTWIDVRNDIFFRNLDGSGVVYNEVGRQTRVLTVRTALNSFSQLGSMSITAFKLTCHAGPQLVFEGDAVFGHFPAEALRNQAGLAPSDDETGWLSAPAPAAIDLDSLQGSPRLGWGKLHLIDRITGFWPDGGKAGKGFVRAEMDIDPRQWFFKAHFFGDPVQPGSVGLEAVVQALQVYMIATNRHEGLASPRFESVATSEPVSWTYRGQILPSNKRVVILVQILEARRTFAKASATLWVDNTKIYSIGNLSVRVVDDEEVLDPTVDTWLNDHCPTYTVPALPMMSIVDRIAAAAQRSDSRRRVVALTDVTLNGWISFASGARRLKTETRWDDPNRLDVTLSVWRDAPHASLSRFDVMATARALLDDQFPSPPYPVAPLEDAVSIGDPYEIGELFHGSSFQVLRNLQRSKIGSSFVLDSNAGAVPRGLWNQVLFDGVTHGIPNESLSLWSDRIPIDQVGYPSRILHLKLYAEPPSDGISSCEVRFAGFHLDRDRFPKFHAQLIKDGRVWAEIDLVYALFPKGPLGMATASQRRAFLQSKTYVPGMALGRFIENVTSVRNADFYSSDWLPGTLEKAFALTTEDPVRELAIKEHVARFQEVHPSAVTVSSDCRTARCDGYPLMDFPIETTGDSEICTVRYGATPRLNCDHVRTFWSDVFGIADWPIADLHIGLIERFVRRVVLRDPAGFAAIRGKPAIYLANHQVAIESILFNVLISALSELPIKVIAKVEHRETWIGQLIAITNRYSGVRAAEPILFFNRADPQSAFDVLAGFRRSIAQTPAALMVHVEGTRAKSCRTAVSQVSSAFLELALSLGCPIVPVRFVGGLPVQPVETRLEFPFAGGQQDIVIGRSIAAEEIQHLSLIERSKLVVNAINELAPKEETHFGTTDNLQNVGNVLIDALRRVSHRCAETDLLLSWLNEESERGTDSEHEMWLRALHMWLREMKAT